MEKNSLNKTFPNSTKIDKVWGSSVGSTFRSLSPAPGLGLQLYPWRGGLLAFSSSNPTLSQVAEVLLQVAMAKMTHPGPSDSVQILPRCMRPWVLGSRPPSPLRQRFHARKSKLRLGPGSLPSLPTQRTELVPEKRIPAPSRTHGFWGKGSL